jgi:hypothetical protein
MAQRLVRRALNVDSAFRSNVLVTPSTDMQVSLPSTVPNVVEMAVAQVEIPPTYYNVSRRHGNRTFVVNDGGAEKRVVQVPDGRYQITHNQDEGTGVKTLADLEYAVNAAMRAAGVASGLVFTIDKATQRAVFATRHVPAGQPAVPEATIFFNVDDDGNVDESSALAGGTRTKLGWLLGFRAATYHVRGTAAAPNAVSAVGEAAAYLPSSRYFYVVVDDYCNEAYEGFTSVFHDSLNTKNVLARVDLGDTVDHTRWTRTPRVYRAPVGMARLRVTVTDELGRVVDLNGNDWSMVLELTCAV